jgi:hypothetical protein
VPYVSERAPGAVSATDSNDRFAAPFPPGRETGTRLVKSDEMLVLAVLDPTSTVGGRATTVTVSPLSASGKSSALKRMVESARSMMPGRRKGLYASFSTRIVYVPIGKLGMR